MPKPIPVMERLWRKVDKRGPDECWPWMGSHNTMRRPYGHIGLLGGGTEYVHRLVYEETTGPIPEGWQVDHLCNNSLCCNPKHLEAVTQQVNLARRTMLWNSAKTHCKRGHLFDEANTYTTSKGRHCRACKRLRYHEQKGTAA
jgi:hypothetical protein